MAASADRATTAIVLFTDVVDSTALRARIGEEQAEELRRQHEELAGRAVARSGGTVVKSVGDGVMATFLGAADAVAAAVAVQQGTDRSNRTAGRERTQVRIGVAAGDVTWDGDDCFGMTVVEAARLCASAEGGHIVVSGTVRALAGSRGGHAYSDAGSLDLKGIPELVPAFRVTWSAGSAAELPLPPPLVVRPGELPFVGRDQELDRLRLRWSTATTGLAQLLTLAGEPGAGKTRLATELARVLHEDGASVLFGRCDESDAVPYQPFVDALRHYVRNAGAERVSDAVGRHRHELARLVPELDDDEGRAGAADGDADQYRLYEAVTGWFANVTVAGPLLLVIDDLHWAGPSTLRMLSHLLRSTQPLQLLILATYRDSDVGRDDPLRDLLADTRRDGRLTAVPVGGLAVSAVAALMRAVELKGATGDAAAEIQDATRGNAFFVEEILHAARDRDTTDAGGSLLSSVGVPEGVREVVSRRVARLGDGPRDLLAVASLVGLEFDLGVVARAAGESVESAGASLDDAVTRRLLEEAGSGGRIGYRFAHDLVRQTLEASLSAARRTALHAAIGGAIEVEFSHAVGDHAIELARHYGLAVRSSAEKALRYAVLAAEKAEAGLAHDQAAAAYRMALDVFEVAGAPGGGRRHLELVVAMGTAQRRAGDPAYRETLLAAGREAAEAGDAEMQAAAALANNRGYASVVGAVDAERVGALVDALEAVGIEETTTRARLLAILAVELTFSPPDWTRRRELSDEALAIARRVADPDTLAHVLGYRHETIWHVSTLAERKANTAEHIALAEDRGDPHEIFHASYNGFWCSMANGDFAEADARLGAMTMMAGDLMEPMLRWQAGVCRTCRLITQGRLADGRVAADEALAHGLSAHQPDAPAYHGGQTGWILFVEGHLGLAADGLCESALANPGLTILHEFATIALLEAGRRTEAREWLERLALGGYSGRPYNEDWMSGIWMMTLVANGLDEKELASQLAVLIEPHADCFDTNGATWVSSAHNGLAVALATTEEWDAADEHFGLAVRADARVGADVSTVLTRYQWAKALLSRGRPSDRDRAHGILATGLADAERFALSGMVERISALATGSV